MEPVHGESRGFYGTSKQTNSDFNIRKLLRELDLRKHGTLPNFSCEDRGKEPKELRQWYLKARVNC